MDINPHSQPSFNLPEEPDNNSQAAADLIRHKLDSLYTNEPDAVTETIESAQEPGNHRSKHQKYMIELASSGKPFAQIQTEWHNYYLSLPDREKHQVWQEFYQAQAHHPAYAPKPEPQPKPAPKPTHVPKLHIPKPKHAGPVVGHIAHPPARKPKPTKPRNTQQTIAQLKKQITSRVGSRAKLTRKQHFKSMAFGLSMGALVVLVLLFGFFNERFITPFITPSRNVSATPLILNSSDAVGSDPKVIVPKINVEVPVVYDVDTVEEHAIQTGLERGVVHYATTSNPGEQGAGAIFGHSSNNILNKGKYKFAFVLLSRMETGDTFYLEKDGVRYVYKIFDKKIVPPTDTSVLGAVPGKTSTMALITCDPPGTSINRLVVWGEQISPDPNRNIASSAVQTDVKPAILAGNAESLWHRIWNSVF